MKDRAKTQPTGFDCPECGFFIEITLEGLLNDIPIRCARCCTDFPFNKNEKFDYEEFLKRIGKQNDKMT